MNIFNSTLLRFGSKGLQMFTVFHILDSFGYDEYGYYAFLVSLTLFFSQLMNFAIPEAISLELIEQRLPESFVFKYEPRYLSPFIFFLIIAFIVLQLESVTILIFIIFLNQFLFKNWLSIFRTFSLVTRSIFLIEFVPSVLLSTILRFNDFDLLFLLKLNIISQLLPNIFILFNLNSSYFQFQLSFTRRYVQKLDLGKLKLFVNDILGNFLLEFPIIFSGLGNNLVFAGQFKFIRSLFSPFQLIFSIKKIRSYRSIISGKVKPSVSFIEFIFTLLAFFGISFLLITFWPNYEFDFWKSFLIWSLLTFQFSFYQFWITTLLEPIRSIFFKWIWIFTICSLPIFLCSYPYLASFVLIVPQGLIIIKTLRRN